MARLTVSLSPAVSCENPAAMLAWNWVDCLQSDVDGFGRTGELLDP